MESFDINESLAKILKEKSNELDISKSEFIRQAIQMKIDYKDDYEDTLNHFIKAEKIINKFKYTENNHCTKNRELNIWLTPDDTKNRKCTLITCQNENCLSNAVMINVLEKHLLDEKGKWKDTKLYEAFSQHHYDNTKHESYLEDEEYIKLIETWLINLMGRYNLK